MEKLNKYIEHTLLKQDASKADLLRFSRRLHKSMLCKTRKRKFERCKC